jgi:hypothetical protein
MFQFGYLLLILLAALPLGRTFLNQKPAVRRLSSRTGFNAT